MYKFTRFLLFVSCLLLSGLAIAAPDGQISFGVDGRTWNRVLAGPDGASEELHKIILIRGILDGMMFGQSPYMEPGPNDVYTNTTYEHLIAAIDQFYSDYRNEKIFVVWALLVISMELKGESSLKIEKTLADYRRRVAALP